LKASILPLGPGAFRSVGPALYIDCWPCSDSFSFGPNRYGRVFTVLKSGGAGAWLPGVPGIGVWLNRRSKPVGDAVVWFKIAVIVPIAVGGGAGGSDGGSGAAGSAGTGGGGSAAAVGAEATAVPAASRPATAMVSASFPATVIRTPS
jgi:hypothetical protein